MVTWHFFLLQPKAIGSAFSVDNFFLSYNIQILEHAMSALVEHTGVGGRFYGFFTTQAPTHEDFMLLSYNLVIDIGM